jgi:hypothetical protein
VTLRSEVFAEDGSIDTIWPKYRSRDWHRKGASPRITERHAQLEMSNVSLMVPREARRTGIRKGLLEDLALKILYLRGEVSLVELSDIVCLSSDVFDETFQFLRKEQLCEVKGSRERRTALPPAREARNGPLNFFP